MSSPTGASALLALLARDPRGDMPGLPGTPEQSIYRARRCLRNAIRRTIRMFGGRVGPAAAWLGVHPANLRAAATALELELPSVRGAPPVNQNARRKEPSPQP
jgi:hypothetical protein